ncbi:MAG: radical SAM family heme chaperone HemW [Candidatus Omnitrophica bacterium]|nr:radical SAM family heme chaperone HemW [Candidatus Omnitrophota bacterium]
MRLYVHIPLCRKRCYYCSFATVIGQQHKQDLLLDCLRKEINQYPGYRLSSIYVGGGTPSFLKEKNISLLFGRLKDHFVFKNNIEITFEANPEDMSEAKMNVLKDVGVNRISLGLQSFNGQALKFLGRTHTGDDNRRTFQSLRSKGFDNISVDLIYNWPRQSAELLADDLKDLLALNADHISLYMLTIEPPSRLSISGCPPLSEEQQRKHGFQAHHLLEEAGYRQYEISNYARTGKQSQHNIGYWSGDNYVGVGPSAHSFVNCRRYWNDPLLMSYMKKITKGESPLSGEENLSATRLFMDRLLFGLRLTAGVSISQLENKYDVKISQGQRDKIDLYVQEGLFVRDGEFLRTTLSGRMVLDEISVNLIDR